MGYNESNQALWPVQWGSELSGWFKQHCRSFSNNHALLLNSVPENTEYFLKVQMSHYCLENRMSWTSILNKNRFSVPNPIFANVWFCMRGCACRHIISDKWSNLSLFSLNAVLIFLQMCSGREKPNGWICSTVGTSGWPKNTRRLVSDKQTCVYPQVLFLFLNSSNALANALMFIKQHDVILGIWLHISHRVLPNSQTV